MKDISMHPWIGLVVSVLMLLAGGPAAAQDKPLREDEVTEQRLIDGLAPPVRAASGVSEYSRGFRPALPPPPRRQSILITFETDSAELLQAARATLDVVARALASEKLARLDVVIEGHADPRGGDAYNQRLSQARADHVVDYLVGQHGVAKERLTAIGKGSSELLNRAEPLAAENRRVTIVSKP